MDSQVAFAFQEKINPRTLLAQLKPLRQLPRTVALVWRTAPGWVAAKLAVLMILGLLPIGTIYLTKLLVDEVTANAQSHAPQFNGALWLIAVMAAVALASKVAWILGRFVDQGLEQTVSNHMLALVYAKSSAVDLELYEKPAYFDALHRAQLEARHRPLGILVRLANVAQDGLTLTALAALLFAMNGMIMAILVIAVIPGVAVELIFSRRSYDLSRENTPRERESWYFHWLLTQDHYAKEIRLFELGALFAKRAFDLRQTVYLANLRLFKQRVVSEELADIPGTLALLGAGVYIAHQAVYGAITLGALTLYYQSFESGSSKLRSVLNSVVYLYSDCLYLENLFEFLDMQPRIVDSPEAAPMPSPIRQGVAFEDVHFTYGDKRVLDGVSFTIAPGEHIALVGVNGAGKTTLIKLLSRLYDPTAGRITVDGIDIRNLRVADLRRAIGVIFQDHVRYNLTVRENIWVGDASASPNDARIFEAAQAAAVTGLIDKMEHGYETRLGNWFEKGHDLSGGEWQKIALARAFFRDAQILVLDEPTSALDAAAEYEVFQKFHELAFGRATVLISHRFSTVRMAHRIFVLGEGRIVECGSHDELMALGGEYAGMYELQARNYR
jgi:ATP-binding cassette, subfamily B, bacterial